MKKIMVIGIIVVVCIMAALFFRNRLNGGMMGMGSKQGSDLIIVNDLSDKISTEYKEDGKDVAKVISPGAEVSGGKGFIRFFIAKRDGSYELTYQFPRPAGSALKIAMSQVISAAQKKNLGDEVYTEKGMISDIKVDYEEARTMD